MEAVRLEQAMPRRRLGRRRVLRRLGVTAVAVGAVGVVAWAAIPDPNRPVHLPDVAAKTDARNMVSMVEACFTDTRDYRGCTGAHALGTDTGLAFGSAAGEVDVVAHTKRTYTVTAHSKSGSALHITKINADTRSFWCEPKGTGGCPASGDWGPPR